MKILVTGNCGFIGQNFVRMYANFHEIIGVDKMGYASDPKAAKVCKTLVGDISDRSFMEGVFAAEGPFDAIIGMAAESHVDRSIQDASPFIQSNVVGTQVLLDLAVREKVGWFLQISTDEVYGDLQPDEAPFSDVHKLKSSSPYAASKAAADMLVLAYHRTHGLNVLITRSCNNYGPYQYPEKFIPVIITKALAGEKIPVYGTGKNIREWIYVEDNCRAIMDVLENGESGGVYNIGTGNERTNLDLVTSVLQIMGKNPVDSIKMVDDRKGHDLRYAVDSVRILRLGWHDIVNLERGLKKTVDWYTKNRHYWEEV